MGTPQLTLKEAHQWCKNHRVEVLAGRSCGCFYCQAIFLTDEISTWIDDEQTAVCPRCGVDAVLPASILDEFEDRFIGDPTAQFLWDMSQYWFSDEDKSRH